MQPSLTRYWSLTARWVFPVASPPLRGGIVTIENDRIIAVEPHGARRADLDLGDAAVLPGLVNAHTHLDLSGLRGLAPPRLPLPVWLRDVIAHRRSCSPEETLASIRQGLDECIRTGTTLLGDISGDGSSWSVLAGAGVRAVVFRELLGLPQDRADDALLAGMAWLTEHPATPTCRPGISPHAPYSFRADRFPRAALLADAFGCPLAVHLAESAEELDLLHHQRGPFVSFLGDLGVWDPEGLAASPVDVMAACDMHGPKLFVHGNYLSPAATLPTHSTIVYCPRTHAAFGHPAHPFRAFLDRGVRVALGTDSLASNPDLDLLAEARFLHDLHPDLPGDVLLRMATLSGAEALGWDNETGSLVPGKSADLVVVPVNGGAADPHALLFDSGAAVQRVLCRGAWLVGG
jgi:cytosine/adenosine deaminase-related metal-dependent hydrolase